MLRTTISAILMLAWAGSTSAHQQETPTVLQQEALAQQQLQYNNSSIRGFPKSGLAENDGDAKRKRVEFGLCVLSAEPVIARDFAASARSRQSLAASRSLAPVFQRCQPSDARYGEHASRKAIREAMSLKPAS